jgi:hypothetical protein
MNHYELHGNTLYKNNSPAICPFPNRIVIPNRLTGELDLNAQPCNNSCPLFEYFEVAPGSEPSVNLYCGSEVLVHKLEKVLAKDGNNGRPN